jgi:hypothetical protein
MNALLASIPLIRRQVSAIMLVVLARNAIFRAARDEPVAVLRVDV